MFALFAGLTTVFERGGKTFSHLNQHPVLIHTVLISIVLFYSLICGIILTYLERDAFHFQPLTNNTTVGNCFARELTVLVNYSRYPDYHAFREKWINTSSTWLLEKCIRNITYTSPFGEWGLFSGGLFALGIITTIGSGTITPPPVTLSGQFFCIVFGVVGIPLAMIVLANLGKHMAELYVYLRQRAVRSDFYRRHVSGGGVVRKASRAVVAKLSTVAGSSSSAAAPVDEEDDEEDEREDEDMSPEAILMLFAVYVFGGSLALWIGGRSVNLIESLYSTFLCLVALDFSGLAPSSYWYIPLMVLYIFTGIGITTMALDAGAIYMKKLHYLGKKLTNPKNVKVTFGGKTIRVEDLIRQMAEECGVPADKISQMNINAMVETAIDNQADETVRKASRLSPVDDGELEEVVVDQNHRHDDDHDDDSAKTDPEPPEEPEPPDDVPAEEEKEEDPPKEETPEPSPEPEPSRGKLETIPSLEESSPEPAPFEGTPIRFSFSSEGEPPPKSPSITPPPSRSDPRRGSVAVDDIRQLLENRQKSEGDAEKPEEKVEELQEQPPTKKEIIVSNEELQIVQETSLAPVADEKEGSDGNTPAETTEKSPSPKEQSPPEKEPTPKDDSPIVADIQVTISSADDDDCSMAPSTAFPDDSDEESAASSVTTSLMVQPTRRADALRRRSVNFAELKDVFNDATRRASARAPSPSDSLPSSTSSRALYSNATKFDSIKKKFNHRKKSSVSGPSKPKAVTNTAELSPPVVQVSPFRTSNFASAKAKFETASTRTDRVAGIPRRSNPNTANTAGQKDFKRK